MDLTGGTRVLAGTAGAALASGLAVVLYGTLRDDLARALGGTCVTLTALTVIALILIRQWIVDTSEERRALADATRRAADVRDRYVASQAALECEQTRLTRDRATERYADAALLKTEREAMAADFETRRGNLIAETMEATLLMFQGGKFNPEATGAGNLIHFPKQHPEVDPEVSRERSREHGGVGP